MFFFYIVREKQRTCGKKGKVQWIFFYISKVNTKYKDLQKISLSPESENINTTPLDISQVLI